jgi:hypothetical protein
LIPVQRTFATPLAKPVWFAFATRTWADKNARLSSLYPCFPVRLSAGRIVAKNLLFDVLHTDGCEFLSALHALLYLRRLSPSALLPRLKKLLLVAVWAAVAILARWGRPIATAFSASHRHTSV